MKVQSLSANYGSKKNVSFGDDCGYVPRAYRYTEAMKDMKNNHYTIQGVNTKDAFYRMHDVVNATMNEAARRPGGEWYDVNKTYTEKTKYVVHKWDMGKEKFATMMTKFWNFSKNAMSQSSSELADNFLTKSEGMKKPNFFQQFLPKYTDYVVNKSVIKDVVDNFLKLGKHRL